MQEQEKQSQRDADSVRLLSFFPRLSVLIGVISPPLTKCREVGVVEGGLEEPVNPSAFIGQPDNKDWCLGGMLQTECAVNMSVILNASFYKYVSGYQTDLAALRRRAELLDAGLKSNFSPESLHPDLPICFPAH